jgi:hypothetical protein
VSAAVTGEDFDVSLALYEASPEGNDCDQLTCVAQSEYAGSRNLLSLRTVSGTTYKVAVAGAYGASAGEYQLVIAVSEFHFHFDVHSVFLLLPTFIACFCCSRTYIYLCLLYISGL